jgi:hypothetical protein
MSKWYRFRYNIATNSDSGEANCVCPVPEILEPVVIGEDEKREMRRSPSVDNSLVPTAEVCRHSKTFPA